MTSMADPRKNVPPGSFAESLSTLGKKYVRELGIAPLAADEDRPESFYATNHYTGTSARGSRAVIRITPPQRTSAEDI